MLFFDNFSKNSSRVLVKHSSEVSLHDPDYWVPRSSELVRLTGIHQMNAEPPLEKLIQSINTPTQFHFIRNHGSVPRIVPEKYRLLVELPNGIHKFSLEDLKQMKSEEFLVTIVCSGNRRKELNAIRKTKGFNWGNIALSNAFWKGVLVLDLLKYCGFKFDELNVLNLHVWFHGEDCCPKEDMEPVFL